MALISKKELLEMPVYQITCSQFAWIYPDKLAIDHAKAVREAWKAGKEVYDKATDEYPALLKMKRGKH